MSLKEFSVLMLVCTIWGLHFVVMKFAMIDVGVPPIFYAALRVSLLALILLPWLRWHKGQMKYVFLGGLGFGAFNYAFMFPALELTTASAAAVTIELYMPFSILLSVIFLKERLGFWRALGAGLAFTGVVIIGLGAPSEQAGEGFALGIAFMACAAMSEAIGAISVKSVKAISPMQLLVWFGIVGSTVLWPLSFILEDNQMRAFAPEARLSFLFCLAYSVLLVSLVAHGSYYWLLQRLPIHVVAPSGLMTTVIGVIGGTLILREALTVTLLLGGVVTLFGIALILWRNRGRADLVITEIS
ncbi:DMT family transporter [Litorimonas sp. WD9-15]|uniref:DMT family transporter n=1 Tax=Litorimonas sp. WD9-15 TaxID=3418716 RepID=UPI003D03E747